MAIPALMGAVIFESESIISAVSLGYLPMTLGFLFSMVTRLLVLKLLFRILENQKFWMFAFYSMLIWLIVIFMNA